MPAVLLYTLPTYRPGLNDNKIPTRWLLFRVDVKLGTTTTVVYSRDKYIVGCSCPARLAYVFCLLVACNRVGPESAYM